jgi:aminoglycoside phosphotransferase (APT) family kinase protein
MTTALSSDVEQGLRRRLEEVCRQLGLDARDAVLIKYTMNAVFLVRPFIVRLARGQAARELAERTAAVAVSLEHVGAPVVSLATEIAPTPLYAGDWVATVWRYAPSVDVAPAPIDLAAPLQAIHAIGTLPVELPRWNPHAKFRRRIAAAAQLPGAQFDELDQWASAQLDMSAKSVLAMLSEMCDESESEVAEIDWHFPKGLIHADAHTGNLILRSIPQRPGPDLSAIMCDLDGVCDGRPEWDLVPQAHGVTRFGRSYEEYQTFADRYGFDILQWVGWPALQRVREIQLVTSTIDSLFGRPAVALQLGHRIRSLKARDTSAVWKRYG